MDIVAQRAAVVTEAVSWLCTPYHHQGFLKGVGVDCAFLLVKVYAAVGLVPDLDPRPYPPDWHMHRDAERYLGWVERYAHEVEAALPGDVIVYKFGRCYAHGGIVVGWPDVVHAYRSIGCTRSRYDEGVLAERPFKLYSLFNED
jgi:cell wall-associated NlpC family hydrolase